MKISLKSKDQLKEFAEKLWEFVSLDCTTDNGKNSSGGTQDFSYGCLDNKMYFQTCTVLLF
jgi:hypothetical protein